MSKIGKKTSPYDKEKIQVVVEDGGRFAYKLVNVTGPLGKLSLSIRKGINITVTDGEIKVERTSDATKLKALHGLYRSLLANMVFGVTEGFEKKLEIHGVGYRGFQSGTNIDLNLGFSHKITYKPPEGISIKMLEENLITVTGADKQLVGQVAAEIRQLRKPEPYKGKGIRYLGEYVRRKAGKAAAVTTK